ncbi:DUF2891 domain-containing protein [Actinokineospora soli]|uniref:DUF2891 domain-containing protein n=1 Tax=Actinokineospora soli TaxID=1048753 RepID=A0ABW2TK74_9PSEU
MDWGDLLAERADELARTAVDSIGRDFPYHLRHLMQGPGDHPAHPRDVHPSFHGSFDWHSCLEMHWVLVRLHESELDVPRDDIAALLDERLAVEPLAREAEYCAANPGHSRPYGLAWALWLAHDARDSRWAAALEPLASVVAANFKAWLPKLTYPVRQGMHANTAFALSRMLPYAEARDPELHRLVVETALRMFAGDTDYPARYEPSGFDFLSPALTEAELMASVSPDFPEWFARFLPDPSALFTPATVSDSSDGLIAHLHGLNLSRAWAFRRLAAVLSDSSFESAARVHADASLSHVSGDDFMVEHWLACYALLMLDAR